MSKHRFFVHTGSGSWLTLLLDHNIILITVTWCILSVNVCLYVRACTQACVYKVVYMLSMHDCFTSCNEIMISIFMTAHHCDYLDLEMLCTHLWGCFCSLYSTHTATGWRRQKCKHTSNSFYPLIQKCFLHYCMFLQKNKWLPRCSFCRCTTPRKYIHYTRCYSKQYFSFKCTL